MLLKVVKSADESDKRVSLDITDIKKRNTQHVEKKIHNLIVLEMRKYF